jgi:SAM-dependent methyltransferase
MPEVYRGFWAREYDARFGQPAPGELEWLVETAARGGQPVCELACGSGRLTVPLARAGIPVTGIDLSEDLITLARGKARSEPAAVRRRLRFEVGDIRAFALSERFGFMFAFFGGFECLLTPEEQVACLACARRHLAPGGLLEVELMAAGAARDAIAAAPGLIRHEQTRRDDELRAEVRIVTEQTVEADRLLVARHAAEVRYNDGRLETHSAVERTRLVSHDEMASAAAEAGLIVERVLGGHDLPARLWRPEDDAMVFDLRAGPAN